MGRLASHPLARFPDFRRFFGARFVSALGDKFFTIALSWWAVNEAGPRGALHLGILMALNLLPSVLFGPLAGTMADRFDRKKCMLLADAFRFAMALLMAIFLITDRMTLTVMYVLVFGMASFMPLFESAAESSLVALTDRDGIASAAAVNSSVVELSNVLGAALGGVALAALGTAGAFSFNGLTFAVSFLLIATVRRSLVPSGHEEQSGAGKSLREILLWLRQHVQVLALLILFGLLNFFAAPLMVSIPMMVRYVFQGAVSWVAFLEASLALGAVTMAFVMSFVSGGQSIRRIFTGVLVLGGAVIAFALSPRLLWGIPCVFLAGAGLAVVNASAMGFFQHRVPDALKGRFFSILTAVAYSVMPLALILNGLVSQVFPVRVVLSADGAMVCFLSLLLCLGVFREQGPSAVTGDTF